MTEAELAGIEDYYSALPASSTMKRLIALAWLGRTIPQVKAEAFAAGAAAMRLRCVAIALHECDDLIAEKIGAEPLPTPEDR